MYKSVRHIFFVFAILATLTACKKDNMYDLFKATGPDVTRVRYVTGFNRIKLDDKIDVYLSQGPYDVRIVAGQNLQMNIRAEVTDNATLYIHNDNKFNFIRSQTRRIKVYVTAPNIYHIWNLGVGTIRCSGTLTQDSIATRSESSGDIYLDVNVHHLNTSSHGNGDVYVTGQADTSYHYMFGTNYLQMANCAIQKYIFIETISSGYAKIQAPANGPIEANIWQSGNIYYTGNPTATNYQRHAKGDLIKE